MRLFCFEDRTAPFITVFAQSAAAAGYDLVLQRPGDDAPGFATFRDAYRHLSVNSVGFELACFHRHFLLAAALGPQERAIMADSDLLVQTPARDLPEEIRSFDHGLVGSVGRSGGVAESDISPHFSLWTGGLARSFCEFLIATYRDKSDALAEIYHRRAAAAARVAVSDMTLLALWRDAAGIAFLDTNRRFGSMTVDHNISLVEAQDIRFRDAFGRKRLRFAPGAIDFVTRDGEPIRPAVIHLQGRYKLAASALARRSRGRLAAVSATIAAGRAARAARAMLAR